MDSEICISNEKDNTYFVGKEIVILKNDLIDGIVPTYPNAKIIIASNLNIVKVEEQPQALWVDFSHNDIENLPYLPLCKYANFSYNDIKECNLDVNLSTCLRVNLSYNALTSVIGCSGLYSLDVSFNKFLTTLILRNSICYLRNLNINETSIDNLSKCSLEFLSINNVIKTIPKTKILVTNDNTTVFENLNQTEVYVGSLSPSKVRCQKMKIISPDTYKFPSYRFSQENPPSFIA